MRVDKLRRHAFDRRMITVRVAREADHEPLLDLMEEFNRGENIEMNRNRTSSGLARLIADESLGRVLIVDDGTVIGYAVLTWGFDLEFGGRDAFLTEIFVAAQTRRHGL